MDLKYIQKLLIKKGYYTGSAYGIGGPRTAEAIIAAINAAPIKTIVQNKPKWMIIAEGEIGEAEIKGGENQRIIEYHASTTLEAIEDEVPWCSSFVCWCLEQADYESTQSAWARSYEDYGEDLDEPIYGCIVVFDWRNGTGHVGFMTSQTNTTITILGGNQSNSVCLATFSKQNISAFKWPVR